MSELETVLVIGGAGFIGSHTRLALQQDGYRVVVYDNFASGHRDACDGAETVEGDLLDEAKLVQTMRDYQIDAVIHFAALIEAGQSVVDPMPFFRTNTMGSLTVLQAMRTAGVGRIVFSSTAAVYGNEGDGTPLSESLPRNPINPYGHSKMMVEVMLENAAAAYGLRATALRYFNAAGADPSQRLGERHDPETHLIPLVIQAALGQRPEIKIFGTDYDTPDGTCIRDYIHVCDLATAHIAALKEMAGKEGGGFQALNLGTGKGHSIREVIDVVRQVSGRHFPIVEATRRPGDPDRLVADAARAAAVLHWTPAHSALEEIVTDAWNFFSAHAKP